MKNKIISSRYEIIKKLGEGSQSTVYKVKDHFDKTYQFKALKLLNISDENEENNQIEAISSEFNILKQLNNENVIKVFEFSFSSEYSRYYYTMEILNGSDLKEHLAKHHAKENILDLIYQCLKGLSYLHSNNIIHYDIKPENIFVNISSTKPIIKILDFGLSEIKQNETKKYTKGTIDYMAPELFYSNEMPKIKVDLYSLGMSFIYALSSKEQIATSTNISRFLNDPSERKKNKSLALRGIEDKSLRNFLAQLSEDDPEERFSNTIEAIDRLNFMFKTKYKLPELASIESCVNSNRFLIREKEFQNLKNYVENFFNAEKVNHLLITGKPGSGKSKILNHLRYKLTLENKPIISVSFTDINTRTPGQFYTYLLNHLKSCATVAIKKPLKQGSEQNIISEYLQDTDQKIIIIFDDFSLYPKLIFNEIIRLTDSYSKKILAIFTYSEQKTSKELRDSFKILLNDQTYQKIKLEPLSRNDIEEIVEDLFPNIHNFSKTTYQKVHNHSKGNFLKVMEILDEFIKKDLISSYNDTYIFSNDLKKTEEIFKLDGLEILEQKMKLLTESEILIIKTIYSVEYKISFLILSKMFKKNVFEIKQKVLKLENLNLIYSEKKYGSYYLTKGKIDKETIDKLITPKDLRAILKMMCIALKPANKSAEKPEMYSAYKLLIQKKKLTKEAVEQKLNQLKGKSFKNLRTHFLELAIKLTKDKQLFFYLAAVYLEITSGAFVTDKQEMLVGKISRMRTKVADKYIRARISRSKLLHYKSNADVHNMDKYLKKEYDNLHKYLPEMDFLNLVLSVIIYLLMTQKVKEGKYFIQMLSQDFEKSRHTEIIFNRLKCIQVIYNLLPFEEKYPKELEKFIDSIDTKKKYRDIYFATLEDYASYFTVTKDKVYFTTNLEARLKKGITLAKKEMVYKYVFSLYNLLGLYFRSIDKPGKAISAYEKILNLEKKYPLVNRSNFYNNIGLIKYDLKEPVLDVTFYIKQALKEQKISSNFNNYSVQAYNLITINEEAGRFNNSYEYLQILLSYLSLASQFYIKAVIESLPSRCSKFIPARKLRQLITDQTSLTEYYNFEGKIKEAYDFSLKNRYDYQKSLTDSFSSNSFENLFAYFSHHKKLPDYDKWFKTIPFRFADPHYIQSSLEFKLVTFLYHSDLKNEKLVFKQAKKLYNNGYASNLFSILNRFIYICQKIEISLKLRKYLDLALKCKEDIKNNSRPEFYAFFKTTYDYKLLQKNLKNYSRK